MEAPAHQARPGQGKARQAVITAGSKRTPRPFHETNNNRISHDLEVNNTKELSKTLENLISCISNFLKVYVRGQ
jgi:hypothetical protein